MCHHHIFKYIYTVGSETVGVGCYKLLNQSEALQSSVFHTDVSGLYPGFVSFVAGQVKSHNNTRRQGDLT